MTEGDRDDRVEKFIDDIKSIVKLLDPKGYEWAQREKEIREHGRAKRE